MTSDPLNADVQPDLKPFEKGHPLAPLFGAKTHIKAHTIIGPDHDDATCTALVTGLAFTFTNLSDGRRHIHDLLVPGDLVGLSAAVVGREPPLIEAVTDCEFAQLDVQFLKNELGKLNGAADSALHLLAADVESLSARSLRMVRGTAIQRLAALLIDFSRRIQGPDAAETTLGTGFFFPFTQEQVADLLGLSAVHVNRTFRKLREAGLLIAYEGAVSLPRPAALAALANLET